MSPGRSRSGATLNLNALIRKYKSSRNSRFSIASRKSLFVAATSRISKSIGAVAPKRVIFLSCSTRNNFVCK